MNERPAGAASGPRAAAPPADVTAASLARVEASLARLESRLAALESHALTSVGVATDAVDRMAADARARGVDVDARLRVALRLAERLTDPAVAGALERALDLAPQAPAAVATAVDAFDGAVARARAAGVDLDERAHLLVRALERLTSPEALDLLGVVLGRLEAVRGLLESGVLDPQATRVVGTAGAALVRTASEPMAPGPGALGTLFALGDVDVRTAVGFGLRFAKNLGRSLAGAPAALPARADG
ncbi:MAG: hypothetical protein U0324_01050 [Polyangiales bacterium]